MLHEQIGMTEEEAQTLLGKLTSMDTTEGSVTLEDSITGGMSLEDYGKDWVRYYGAVGGNLVVNANLSMTGKEPTTINRITGSRNNIIESGSVIGGVGGSAAVGVGNISASAYGFTLTTGGTANTTVNGDVTTKADAQANLVGFMNGGLAAGVGGTATSTVTGNTELTIDGSDRILKEKDFDESEKDAIPQLTTALNVMKGSGVNAIGVLGGGTAASTLGGSAQTHVKGTSTININNATVIGAIGGGAAASIDATDVGDVLADKLAPNPDSGTHPSVGDPSGESGFGINFSDDGLQIVTGEGEEHASAHVTISNVHTGGKAESITGDTNINVTGTSTAAGLFGGGVAAATQTYYDHAKPEVEATDNADAKYTIYGKSQAYAESGKATIHIDMDKKLADGDEKKAFVESLGTLKQHLSEDKTQATDLKNFANKGAVGAVFGGGASLAYGSIETAYEYNHDDLEGAEAISKTDGADINLVNGYAAGIMGGGIAGVRGNAYAESSMTDTVNINIGTSQTKEEVGAEAVGVFGNGLAYYTGEANGGKKNLTGQAVVTAQDTNINVAGMADGLIGGGMAIDDSQSNTVNAKVQTNGTAAINVYEGAQIGKVGLEALTGLVGNVPNEGQQVDMASYVDGVNEAAGNAAIAAGGIALGGGADAYVKDAVVNIAGGTVTGDIYGGGIAAYGYAGKTSEDGTVAANGGSRVENSTINLIGGTVNGNIYAGGAVSVNDKTKSGYTSAIATVDTATVNLAGADVTGILYGTGTVNAGTENATVSENDGSIDSTLNLAGENTLSLVNGASKIQKFDTVYAKAGSVTKVEGLTTGNTTGLIDGGTVKAESGAYLDVSALGADGQYLIANHTNKESAFWDDSALVYDRMSGVYATTNVGSDNSSYTVNYATITEDNADEAAQSMADALDAEGATGLFQQGMRDGWNNVSDGADEYFDDWQNHKDSNAAFGKGMMIGEDAAVTGNTVSIARDMADNVMQRLSFTDDYVQDAGWVNNDGGIWAKYIHRKYETEGMGSSFGGIHSSTDYDGAIVGVDFAKHGNFQSGVAFHYGSGDGNGLISRNDYDAWGFTLYGSLKDEEAGTNLMADIGYVTSDNDIDGTVAGKSLRADRDVDAWTIGLRGEKEYVFGQNQLVPYVGLRYMSVNPARYTAYYNGKAAFDYDADNQNLWLLPIGVSFRNETVTDGGWRITPKLDLSYIWAFGDTDTDMTVNAGTYSTALYYDVMDDNSWLASLGVEATKDVWSFGVGYGYQKGDDTKNKTWFVNASYAF